MAHKTPKKSKIKNLGLMCPRYPWDEVVYQFLGSSERGSIFGDFPTLKTENPQKRPNFVALYLGNRWELRGQWAHFEKKITRATTYGQTKKNKFLAWYLTLIALNKTLRASFYSQDPALRKHIKLNSMPKKTTFTKKRTFHNITERVSLLI